MAPHGAASAPSAPHAGAHEEKEQVPPVAPPRPAHARASRGDMPAPQVPTHGGAMLAPDTAQAYAPPCSTAWELHQDAEQTRSLSFGCHVLDGVFGGGVRVGCVTEIAGESACGKTQLCLHLLLRAQLPVAQGGLGAATCFVSTEGAFPMQRYEQLAAAHCAVHGGSVADALDRVFVERVDTAAEQLAFLTHRLPLLLGTVCVRLVIVDSIASLARSEYTAEETCARGRDLVAQAAALQRLAAEHRAAVVVINQATDVVEQRAHVPVHAAGGAEAWTGFGRDANARQADGCVHSRGRMVRPALGLLWSNCVTVRMMLSREDTAGGGVVRRVCVMFAPHVPYRACTFEVTADGVRGVACES